jgi:hypothetical protein
MPTSSAATRAARAHASPATQPTSPSNIRSAVVTFGPSLMLDGVLAACTAATVGGLLRRRRGRSGRLRPWLALGAAAPRVHLLGLRRWVLHWGATQAEVNARLPGDQFVPQPVWQCTRAIDIRAPVEAVWPWLVQMGQDRGGLYSYDWLENLAGLDFHSANRIVSEWQHVQVGDLVRFAPDQDTLVVAQVEPNRCLVWRVLEPGTHEPADLAHGPVAAAATWAFVLTPVDPERTRLIQRFRFGSRPRALGWLYTGFVEIPHFVMERRMLLGIRMRAEGAAHGASAADSRRR